jgi:predicted  nucleic acid-binding Zn-ribbon protein
MKLWQMRAHELDEKTTRHALLADLVDTYREAEPSLVAVIRRLVDMVDDSEAELSNRQDELRDQIEELEADLAAVESRLYGETADLESKIDDLEADVADLEKELAKARNG